MANLRRKEKTNGLVGAKNRGGEGQPKEKKRKRMDNKGLNIGGGAGQPKEKRENKWISTG